MEFYLDLFPRKYKYQHAAAFTVRSSKKINDTYGHSGGDEVLKSFANHLNEMISKPHIVGRIGGEEFLAILIESDSQKIIENSPI